MFEEEIKVLFFLPVTHEISREYKKSGTLENRATTVYENSKTV